MESGDIADGRRKWTREIVTVEKNAVKRSGIEELGRDKPIEIVAM